MKNSLRFASLFVLLTAAAGNASAGSAIYDFTAQLSDGITMTGQVTVNTSDPGYVAGGTVNFNTGGITSFKFTANDGSASETIDSQLIANPTPQTMKLTFSVGSFPQVGAWDFSFSNEGAPLIQAITVRSPSNSGYEQWAGNQLDGAHFPSSGVWTYKGLVGAPGQTCNFTAHLSDGITMTGQVTVNTGDPGYVPGGTVDFHTGGITAFKFTATNGSTSETINSQVIANPTPQTMKLTYSVALFPQVAAWDFSFSNEGVPLIQAITVHSPSNSGYEQWAGDQLDGAGFPSSGVWDCTGSPTPAVHQSWGKLKAVYR